MKKNKIKESIRYIILIIFIIGFSFLLYKYVKQENKIKNLKKEETEMIDKFQEKEIIEDKDSKEKKESFLPKINFDELKKKNPDVDSWLYIPNTKINRPVMQEKKINKFYYEWININKKWDGKGELFKVALKEGVNPAINIIYGHNFFYRNDDFMFTLLPKHYGNKEKALNNKYIYYYYPDRIEKWEVVGGKFAKPNDSIYYSFAQLNSKAYKENLDYLHRTLNFKVDDKAFPKSDENLLILSTCYKNRQGRFYAAFKKVGNVDLNGEIIKGE